MLEKTFIQQFIEEKVTNGIGYDSKTDYAGNLVPGKIMKYLVQFWVNHPKDFIYFKIDLGQIKDSSEGLRIHLAELDYRSRPTEELRRIILEYKKLAINKTFLKYNETIDLLNDPPEGVRVSFLEPPFKLRAK